MKKPGSFYFFLFLLLAGLIGFSSLLFRCEGDSGKVKKQKFITGGRKIYNNRCANCHGKQGKGMGKLYPPLAGADYLRKRKKIICITKYGIDDSIYVNGTLYNRKMPSNTDLTPIDIAYVLTYINNKWENKGDIFKVKEVKKVLNNCN